MIIQFIIWVVGIIVAFMLIQKIFGHSPTYEQIIVGLLILLIGKVYTHGSELGALREFKKAALNSFSHIKEDMDNVKKNVQETNTIIKKIEEKIAK